MQQQIKADGASMRHERQKYKPSDEADSSGLHADSNPNFVVLKYIEPPRQLLKVSNRMNCVYKKQLNPLPHIFKYCQQLHPLAQVQDYLGDLPGTQGTKTIYSRDLTLKINPFEPRNFFRSGNFSVTAKDPASRKNPSSSDGLQFDSHFESGNLLSVDKQILSDTYHLKMQNDINTFGCTQWFFFRAKNARTLTATFLINNFYKAKSLYQKGMKVMIFSTQKFVRDGTGWVRGGDSITYFRNNIKERNENGRVCKQFYTLRFNYQFSEPNDEVYFAYNCPYTYSRLNNFLNENRFVESQFYSCRSLCQTAAENKVFLVTITNPSVDKREKNCIFITSRVHPGETVSSLVMEGIITFLLSDDPVARTLRDRIIFKLVPMLNPDGVIHGNYRTNLAGIDLNRVWDSADRQLSPEIYELKKYIYEFNKQCQVVMFCDLHGHSSKKSAFIYGCQGERVKSLDSLNECRLFPFMLSCINEDFRYRSCSFVVQKSKAGTARVVLWKELKIPNIFTLEASFCSPENSEYHFRPQDYLQIGLSFCKNIHEYFLNPDRKKQFQAKLKDEARLHTLEENEGTDDSESDTDLLDRKTLNQLKSGASVRVWERKKVLSKNELVPKAEEPSRQVQPSPNRRYITEKARKLTRTECSPDAMQPSSVLSSKKTVVTAIPTKRIIFEQEDRLRQICDSKIRKNTVCQKVEQNYRGKSSIYRIQRKNLKNILVEPQLNRNKGTVFQFDTSLDLF